MPPRERGGASYHTTWGQWVVDFLLHTRSLPGGSGHWNSCFSLPDYLVAEGNGSRTACGLTASGRWGSGSPTEHCHTAWGQWALELLLFTAVMTSLGLGRGSSSSWWGGGRFGAILGSHSGCLPGP